MLKCTSTASGHFSSLNEALQKEVDEAAGKVAVLEKMINVVAAKQKQFKHVDDASAPPPQLRRTRLTVAC
jgi:hypothetical protein